jgi:hypothetical protein
MEQLTADTTDQTDEDILTYTVSDEALEAAVGAAAWTDVTWYTTCSVTTPVYR